MQRLLYSYLCVSNDLRMRYIQLHPITRIAKEIEIVFELHGFRKKDKIFDQRGFIPAYTCYIVKVLAMLL